MKAILAEILTLVAVLELKSACVSNLFIHSIYLPIYLSICVGIGGHRIHCDYNNEDSMIRIATARHDDNIPCLHFNTFSRQLSLHCHFIFPHSFSPTRFPLSVLHSLTHACTHALRLSHTISA